jgi:hypothetical protein
MKHVQAINSLLSEGHHLLEKRSFPEQGEGLEDAKNRWHSKPIYTISLGHVVGNEDGGGSYKRKAIECGIHVARWDRDVLYRSRNWNTRVPDHR